MDAIDFDTRAVFIGGQWQSASFGRTLSLINPSDGSELTQIARGGPAEIDAAVSAAREAGASKLVVLACTASYPADPVDANLQTIPALRSIPILAVTAYDEIYVRRELQAAGIMGFLRKPITFTELVHAVATLAFVGGAG